jgi:hypothetical protein
VAVQPHEFDFPTEEVAIGLLLVDEPAKAAGDGFLMPAFLLSVAGSVKGEQGKSRRGCVGLEAAVSRAFVISTLQLELVDAPSPVSMLMTHQPLEAGSTAFSDWSEPPSVSVTFCRMSSFRIENAGLMSASTIFPGAACLTSLASRFLAGSAGPFDDGRPPAKSLLLTLTGSV